MLTIGGQRRKTMRNVKNIKEEMYEAGIFGRS
nr:MAG TPA: hypothetical protein [Bacteriophage sp.]